jgi:hypothetical protein
VERVRVVAGKSKRVAWIGCAQDHVSGYLQEVNGQQEDFLVVIDEENRGGGLRQ